MDTMAEGPICIIGMHRSGTSMVASLLQRCGLALGSDGNLVGASDSNPKGHFEHPGFLDLNDSLLKHLGGSWENPPDLRAGWEQDASLKVLVHDAELLLRSFSGYSHWGWKDPRTTILLPFWRKLIPNLRFVICLRNPLAVARSLAKRDGLSIAAGAHLWSLYTKAAIRETNGYPSTLAFYENFFRRPLGEVKIAAEFCGLETPIDPDPVHKTISKELRHESDGLLELLNETAITFEHKLLYLGLLAIWYEESASQLDNKSRSGRVAAGAKKLLQLLLEFRREERVARLEALLASKEQLLSTSRATIAEREKQIATLEQHNDRLQVFADAVRQTLAYRFYRTFLRPISGK
jgi:hypothetical protein